MTVRAWPLVLCLLAPQSGGDGAVADYRAGRYEAARAAFAAELEAAGPAASSLLRTNLALAALRVQRAGDAEEAVRPVLDSADAEERSLAEFLLAHAAWLHAERAAAAGRLPDAEPMAWESALRSMRSAHARWCRASTLRGTWPEALRNAERAWRRLTTLQEERDAAKPPEPKRTDAEPPPPPPAGKGPEEEVQPELSVAPLTPAELARLRDRIAARDREKRDVRRAGQRAAAVAGERGW